MNEKIVVIGSSNTDMVTITNTFPLPGETVLGGRFFMNQGGKGANQAVAAARLGGRVTFICRVGQDMFGAAATESIKNEGIDVSTIVVDMHHPSGVAQIIVDSKGENSIVVAPGANMNLCEDDINNARQQIKDAGIILVQLEVPLETVRYAARKGYELGKKVILNPAPATALPDDLFSSLYLITPNESESELLTGVKVQDDDSAEKAAGLLRSRGVSMVIITMGAKGVYISSEEISLHIPAPLVKAVDTTAAGDTFNGALAVALANGESLTDAVTFANHAAALTVTRTGAQSSIPTLIEVRDFMKKSHLKTI